MRVFLIGGALCALAASVAASAALAGQPVAQTLTPPPPSFETCKAVGNGTICEGMVSKETYGPYDTGIACGTFDVFDSGVQNEVAKRTYDADGNLVSRVRHDRSDGALSRLGSSAALPYTQTQGWTDALAVPGDFGSSTLTVVGSFIVHSPTGAPVLTGAGRTIFAPDGTILFQAGPTGFFDLVAGEPAAVAAVCKALS